MALRDLQNFLSKNLPVAKLRQSNIKKNKDFLFFAFLAVAI